jgi:hypothetical protein
MLQAFQLLIIIAATAVVAVVICLGVMILLSKLSGKKNKA